MVAVYNSTLYTHYIIYPITLYILPIQHSYIQKAPVNSGSLYKNSSTIIYKLNASTGLIYNVFPLLSTRILFCE